MNTALELRQITKRFGATQILRGVDLSVRQGERHALIGPNGAGKSTLFDLVAGRTRPTSGRVILDGMDVTGLPAYRLGRMGLARSFQTSSVFAGLSVWDNLRCAVLGARTSWKARWFGSNAIDHETRRVLESIGLFERRGEPAANLSHAELRALDLGLALSSGASTILLDEPTAGMNRSEAARALALIRATTQGKTLLIVEHDMEAVFALADTISVLVHGRLVASGTPDEVAANAAVRSAYLGDAI
ncbi:ABC transporter-like protein [Caballeronia sordidicola]|uniref:ABC transporter-like protein n=1 Tax=Caballeronia sordidicola TaxID=196367 RepID=A0A158GGZ2_CABSO|nr:ABC transporter ATP-binding protein [Caballeronia sordidicola]SAL31111.1 ABC transporter-like protein [Caballeronia sordidicola]